MLISVISSNKNFIGWWCVDVVSYLRAGVQKVRQLCQLGVGAKHCLLTPEKSEILKGTFSLPLKHMKYERLSPYP